MCIRDSVETMQVPACTHVFFAGLAQHGSLARAASEVATLPQFDLPGAIALLLQHPLVTHMEFES